MKRDRLRRRQLLIGGSAVCSTAVAGCTDAAVTDGPPAEPSASVETTDQDCASVGEETVTVAFETSQRRVTGTIQAPTPCYLAAVKTLRVDDTAVTVAVTTKQAADDEPCVQCVGAIDYTATITDSDHDRIYVEHHDTVGDHDTAYATTAVDGPTDQVQVKTTATDCGAGADVDEPTVTKVEAGLSVSGQRQSPTPCYFAVAESLSCENEELILDIGVREAISEPVCVDCLGVVSYAVDLPLSAPEEVAAVRVEHDGEEVAVVNHTDFENR